MFRAIRLLAALVLLTMGIVGIATPAQAHNATGGATCSGVVLDASSYDGGLANNYSLTLDQTTLAGTFGASVHQVIPVPQDGAVHTWSWSVEAQDGTFRFTDSGQVGPCGTPPVVDECPELTGDQPVGTPCTSPPDLVESTNATVLDCDDQEQVTTTTTITTAYVFDQATQTWVPGTPVETQSVTSVPATPRDCDEPTQPPTEPPVDECPDVAGVQDGNCEVDESSTPPTNDSLSVQPAAFAAPANVLPAAGAASTSSNQDVRTLIGASALAGGLLLLGGLTVMRRRANTA